MADLLDVEKLVQPWSPWWEEKDWSRNLAVFERPVFRSLLHDLETLGQIISVTGPRRVGKSTILKQVVRHLIENDDVSPDSIAYFSFDDPALYRALISGGEMFELLMEKMRKAASDGVAYVLLDEIQTLDRWEQYLKKYFDLDYPIKFVISGSASSPIFKRSRESLLGRIKDFHMLPFSFREYVLCNAHEDKLTDLTSEIDAQFERGQELKGMFAKHPDHIELKSVSVPRLSEDLWNYCEGAFDTFVVEGGFPEVWKMQSHDQKIDYLFDNQVKKVIMEDLVLAIELRKPELLKRFYISLLEKPGREVNKTKLSQELGIDVRQIDKYLPLLEMTDLVRSSNKFRASSQKVRTGNQKFYPTDMALRNAVLRIGKEILADDTALGLYGETFVYNALKKWPGVLAVDFFRSNKQEEVDFIVHTGPTKYLPVEVKYAELWRSGDLKAFQKFRSKHTCHVGLIVTKLRDDFGRLSSVKENPDDIQAFCLPLIQFLLLFD